MGLMKSKMGGNALKMYLVLWSTMTLCVRIIFCAYNTSGKLVCLSWTGQCFGSVLLFLKYLWTLRSPHNVHIEIFKCAEGDVGGWIFKTHSILSVIQVESSVCLILLERRGSLLDTIELLLSSALWVKVVLCWWVM